MSPRPCSSRSRSAAPSPSPSSDSSSSPSSPPSPTTWNASPRRRRHRLQRRLHRGRRTRRGDEVRIAGVKVGRVTGVALDGPKVKVTFEVGDAWSATGRPPPSPSRPSWARSTWRSTPGLRPAGPRDPHPAVPHHLPVRRDAGLPGPQRHRRRPRHEEARGQLRDDLRHLQELPAARPQRRHRPLRTVEDRLQARRRTRPAPGEQQEVHQDPGGQEVQLRDAHRGRRLAARRAQEAPRRHPRPPQGQQGAGHPARRPRRRQRPAARPDPQVPRPRHRGPGEEQRQARPDPRARRPVLPARRQHPRQRPLVRQLPVRRGAPDLPARSLAAHDRMPAAETAGDGQGSGER